MDKTITTYSFHLTDQTIWNRYSILLLCGGKMDYWMFCLPLVQNLFGMSYNTLITQPEDQHTGHIGQQHDHTFSILSTQPIRNKWINNFNVLITVNLHTNVSFFFLNLQHKGQFQYLNSIIMWEERHFQKCDSCTFVFI